jgi:hypothetical protein
MSLVFITGPSHSGKSFLREYAIDKFGFEKMHAVTTREIRHSEVDKHRFVSLQRFMELMKRDKLCLIGHNHGNFYGYYKDLVSRYVTIPNLLLLEVDLKTALNGFLARGISQTRRKRLCGLPRGTARLLCLTVALALSRRLPAQASSIR